MNFGVSHIYKESNICADKLATYDFSIHGSCWRDSIPHVINEDFNYNRVGLPNYRFI